MWPVLKSLPPQNHPDLIIGLNQADDSGIMRLDGDTAIIMTVDFFPAIVDDPYIFGQVAAANALSDVYAMGGRPLSALNIVGFPEKELPIEVLSDVLRGGADKVNEAGAVVIGGHTIKDSELKYGLSVVGIIHPDKILRLGGAQPGDRLVLTKPLGTGIYSTALKSGKLPEDHEKLFYDVMTGLNMEAAGEMHAFGARACTDVTGFGLLGHAFEMAEASEVTLEISTAAIPLLPDALKLARGGFLTGAGMSNREFAGEKIRVEGGLEGALEMILYDPQTSGGLLVALPGGSAGGYVESIIAGGADRAAVIGEVGEYSGSRIILRS